MEQNKQQMHHPLTDILPSGRKVDTFARIQDYVDTHLFEKLTLQDVAESCCVSISSVSHLFQQRLGISCHRYISEHRLSAAANLIRSGISLDQVCRMVGYQDYSSFYRAFCKFHRCSPREFLKSSHTAAPNLQV